MKTVLELKELRAAKHNELDALVTTAEAANRGFEETEKTRFDALQAEIDVIDADIRRAEGIEKLKMDKAKNAANRQSPEQKLKDAHSMTRAVNALVSHKQLEGAEAEMHQEAEIEARHAGIGSISGIGLPSWMIRFDAPSKRTDWNVGTPGDGGYTVQQTIQPIVEPLRPMSVLGGMGITVRQGLTGNLRFPTDTAGSGAWEGEVDANANYSPSISYVDSSPKRFGAKATLSKQLLAQSPSISDAYVRRMLELTIGTAVDVTGIEGGGSNEPVGILGNSGVAVLNAGLASATGVNANGSALVWGDIVALWSEIAQSNVSMENLYFLTNAKVFESGSRIPRQTSGIEGNFIFNETRRVYGEQVMLSNNVPSDLSKGGSSTLSALIYGNFRELALHQWGGVDLVIDPYTLADTAQIRIIANIWLDWCITRPTAFAVIKDIVA
jgi:HK97 family phage major capsid protein